MALPLARINVRTIRTLAVLSGCLALTVLFASPAYAVAPTNDDITGATTITGIPFTDTVDTTEATAGEGDSCGNATVWYTFTPDTSGSYAFTTFGSDYDTTLGLYEGTVGSLTLLACNDDAIGLQSAIGATLDAGVTYYIEAGTCCGAGNVGQVGPGGTLVFNADFAPDALEVEVAINGAEVGDVPGTVIITGTVVCNEAAWADVYGEITQRQGLDLARAGFYTGVPCSSTPTTWTVTSDAGSRIWLPARAEINVTAYACDGFTCDEDSSNRTVRVRR
jgi:hypothetical protein